MCCRVRSAACMHLELFLSVICWAVLSAGSVTWCCLVLQSSLGSAGINKQIKHLLFSITSVCIAHKTESLEILVLSKQDKDVIWKKNGKKKVFAHKGFTRIVVNCLSIYFALSLCFYIVVANSGRREKEMILSRPTWINKGSAVFVFF